MVELSRQCPACGSRLSLDSESSGLCLGCVFELALESPSLRAEAEPSEAGETLVFDLELTEIV